MAGAAQELVRNIQCSLGSVPKEWVSEKTGFAVVHIDKALAKDNMFLAMIFMNMINAASSAVMPKGSENKQFWYFVCVFRWAEAGLRFYHDARRADAVIDADGNVNHARWSYEYICNEGGNKLTKVLHRPTCDVGHVDKDIIITDKFVCKAQWSDWDCIITNNGAAKYHVKDFFTIERGPHAVPQLRGNAKGWEFSVRLATERMHDLEKDKRAAGIIVEDATKVEKEVNQEKKAMLAKARADMLKRREDARTARDRTVKLRKTAPPTPTVAPSAEDSLSM